MYNRNSSKKRDQVAVVVHGVVPRNRGSNDGVEIAVSNERRQEGDESPAGLLSILKQSA